MPLVDGKYFHMSSCLINHLHVLSQALKLPYSSRKPESLPVSNQVELILFFLFVLICIVGVITRFIRIVLILA